MIRDRYDALCALIVLRGDARWPARGLAAFLTVAGVAHFAVPRAYDTIVPRQMPGRPRAWTNVSGLAELATAALVAAPRTRRVGALVSAALFVLVFPANVKMALDWARQPNRSAAQRLVAWARLPLQVPLVLWALRVAARGSNAAGAAAP